MRLGIQTNFVIVRQGLEDFKSDVPKVGRLRLYRLGQRVQTKMKEVAPEIPGQKYKRTGNYVAAWELQSEEKGYALINEVTDKRGKYYASRVAGNAFGLKQAYFHKGRWNHLRTVTDVEISKEAPEAAAALRLVARRDLPHSATSSV